MPSSFVDSVPGVMHLAISVDPQVVVDVGPGYGKYGLMCREYLPNLQVLQAVEVEEGRLPTQDAIYDHIVTKSVLHVAPPYWGNVELVLLIDVIEHMSKEQGKRLLRTWMDAGCSVIVSTPKIFEEQHDDHNPYEEHVSLWTWEDFIEFRIVEDRSTIDSIIFRLCR